MPGRPRKSLFEQRCSPIGVRFKLDEAAQLDLFAAAAGLSKSDYIRACALAERPAPGLNSATKHNVYRLLFGIERGLRDGVSAAVLADNVKAVLAELEK